MRKYLINGTQFSLAKSSFSYNDKINERTTSSAIVKDHPDFEIEVGMEVTVEEDGDILFGGTIDNIREYGPKSVLHRSLSCVDFSQLLDKRLIADSFENVPAGNIVRSFIQTTFSKEGIIEGDIQDGPTISKAVFNYDNGNKAMNYLQDVTGFNWFVDHEKKLHFVDRSTFTAPFGLTDTSYNYSDFEVKKQRADYRNRQYVRAGRDTTQEIQKEKPTPGPDGVSKTFIVRFPVAKKPRIFVDGVEVAQEDIGVNGLDKNKSFYFSFNSNEITQDEEAVPLAAGSVLEVTYQGLYPIMVVVENIAEITNRQFIEGGSGVYESIIEEDGLDTRDAAIEFANGKLEKYGLIPKIINFNTHKKGLRAGHLLSIQNSKHKISGVFLIESVAARVSNGITFYSVKCLDGSALGGWEQFFKGLLNGQKKLVIRENEVLVLHYTLDERTGWEEITDVIPPSEPNDLDHRWAETIEDTIYACPVVSEDLYPSEDLKPC